jgi:hypothetical protein
VADVPGLYFLGLPWQHTRGSALLGFLDEDAAHLAGSIHDHRGTAGAGPQRDGPGFLHMSARSPGDRSGDRGPADS